MFQTLKRIVRNTHRQYAETVNFSKQSLCNVVYKPSEREVEEIQIPVPWGHVSGELYIKV
jgi:hypothetical protein